jgi:hypothetical protein
LSVFTCSSLVRLCESFELCSLNLPTQPHWRVFLLHPTQGSTFIVYQMLVWEHSLLRHHFQKGYLSPASQLWSLPA